MSTKYEQLIDLVRDWSNRDETVLPDSIIRSSLEYAADEAYRKLEIPPLESTTYYFVTEDGVLPTVTGSEYANILPAVVQETAGGMNFVSMAVPINLVSFIFLRVVGAGASDSAGNLMLDVFGNPFVCNIMSSTVFNEKTDIRTFHDVYACKTTENFWARQGGSILAAGNVSVGDIIEVHYYRRESALNSRGLLPGSLDLATAVAETGTYEVIDAAAYALLEEYDARTYEELEGSYVRAIAEEANWLRDENQRVLVFGALHRIYDYLQEDDQSQKYMVRFETSIQELNNEEKQRTSSGGNISVNYSGSGII